MIKGVANAELRKLLRHRLVKLDEIEAMPDPGPGNPQERSNQLFLLAFRRGTVRQLAELIVLAEYDIKKPPANGNENDMTLFREAVKNVTEREKRMLEKEYISGRRKHWTMKKKRR